MKRTGLKRKTPLKSGSSKLGSGSGLARSSKRIPQQSPKRIAEKDEREAMRQRVIARDGGCVGPARGLPGACGTLPDRYGLEVHEFRQRSTHPGSHLRDEDAVALCAVHHSYCTSPSGERLVIVMAAGMIERATT